MYPIWILITLAVSGTTGSNIWRRQSFSAAPSGAAGSSAAAPSLQASAPAASGAAASSAPAQSGAAQSQAAPNQAAPSAAAPSGAAQSQAAPSGAAPSGAAPSGAAPAAAGSSVVASAAIAWPSSAHPSATAQANPLTKEQQVGSSNWGSLSQRTFPKWIDTPSGKPYEKAPWGDCTTTNCDSTLTTSLPDTNVTRHYDFTVSRGQLSPDGVLRDVILINGQFPGPLIHGNWGDWIEVTVHNNIREPEEGTSLHWHGALQFGSQWQDGTPGVSQCPIAPGQSYTYKFRADQYGTSMYHAHYSAQYTAGVVGPMQIYGPSQLHYDIDLGPVLVSDWNHIPYFRIVQNVVTQNLTTSPPRSDSGLINGRGRYDCSKPSYGSNGTDWLASNLPSRTKWSCVDGAERAKFQFQRGKVHRLRFVNVGADGIQKVSIDGHKMTVIATDYVPTVPYTTDAITLGIGQRTDVLVTAGGDSNAAYWMRSEILDAATCGGLTPPGTNNVPVLAGIYYEKADTSVDPKSTSSNKSPSCDNDPLEKTQPEYAQAPSDLPFYQNLLLELAPNATGSYEWLINGQTFRADFNEPLLYEALDGIYDFPDNPEWNVYNFAQNTSVILNITNATPMPHPIHMHGHNFYVLAVGGVGPGWDGTVTNPKNPMRRDVQIVPALGYIAIQFEANNPGVWPLHCHVAWHLSGGWAINIMSQPDQLGDIPKDQRASTCDAWSRWSSNHQVDQIDSGT